MSAIEVIAEIKQLSPRERAEVVRFVLEPVKSNAWPTGFFDAIHIADPAFSRPAQGELPSVKSW